MSQTLAAPRVPLVGASPSDREHPPKPMLYTLVERLQKKDESALDPFITHTRPLAYRVAHSMLGDPHRCEDVLQDVYLTVYQKIGQLREAQAFRGWFCSIVINRCRKVLRERPAASLDELLEAGGGPATAEMAERVQDRLQVQDAMARLNDQDRVILTLREVFDMAYQEIADSLEIPLGTVRSRLAKARLRLLTELERTSS